MNKKDFWTLIIFNFVTLVLLIEHLCGLQLALPFMCVWTIMSLIVHICVLKDYVFTVTIEEE
jgi:hypothetical protein